MKFRKKPVVIEAVQWHGCKGNCSPHVDELGVTHTVTECGIVTLEGFMKLTPGDWIITGVKGEKYPCKPDIFVLTYEPVEEK